MIGAVVVTFLVTKFAPEARGHGVPEVMDAIFYHEGRIRPVVAAIKSLASAFSIGSGASVGREGPDHSDRRFASARRSAPSCVCSPGSASRSSRPAPGPALPRTFNTPIGGVLFAIELMLPEVSVRTFLPVALATGTATWIGHVFFGLNPAFLVPDASRAGWTTLDRYARCCMPCSAA